MSDIPYTEEATKENFRPERLDGMRKVTKDEFFAYIGPRDIVVKRQWNRYFSEFETRDRVVVGRVYSQQKYRFGESAYFLKEGA